MSIFAEKLYILIILKGETEHDKTYTQFPTWNICYDNWLRLSYSLHLKHN